MFYMTLKHLFPFIYFIGCVDNWTKVVFTQSAQTIPLNLFHTVPHGYKFIFKWVVWVQLLKWWVKFFLYGKDPIENIFCHSFI